MLRVTADLEEMHKTLRKEQKLIEGSEKAASHSQKTWKNIRSRSLSTCKRLWRQRELGKARRFDLLFHGLYCFSISAGL